MSMANGTSRTEGHDSKLNSTVHEVLLKLNELIKQETTVIDTGQQEAHNELASKKLRLLVQLQTLTSNTRPEDISTVNRHEIGRLKGFLIENVQRLEMRINAINELASTIENAVRDNESDGTYYAGQFGAVYE